MLQTYHLHIYDKTNRKFFGTCFNIFPFKIAIKISAKVGANGSPIPSPSHCLYSLPLKIKNENFTAYPKQSFNPL